MLKSQYQTLECRHFRPFKKLVVGQMEKDAELIPIKPLKLSQEQFSRDDSRRIENDDSICELGNER